MAIFNAEVVIGAKHIGGDDCRVTMSILLEVRPVNKQTHIQSRTSAQLKLLEPYSGFFLGSLKRKKQMVHVHLAHLIIINCNLFHSSGICFRSEAQSLGFNESNKGKSRNNSSDQVLLSPLFRMNARQTHLCDHSLPLFALHS